VLDNRHILKRSLAGLGLPTSPFITYDPSTGPFRPKVHSRFIRIFRDHWGGYAVSPAAGMPSQRRIVADEAALSDAVAAVFEAQHGPVLIESHRPVRLYRIFCCGRVTARGRRLQRRAEPFTFGAAALDPTKDAAAASPRLLDPTADGALFAHLHELAREVFVELGLEALVRWEIASDPSGALSITGAYGAPDLLAPGSDALGAATAAHGMDGDDLVLSLLADRMDLLLSHRRGSGFGALG
jgi:D-alanine-D-alanine ligase